MQVDTLLLGYLALFLCIGLFKGYAIETSRKLRYWQQELESLANKLDSRANKL